MMEVAATLGGRNIFVPSSGDGWCNEVPNTVKFGEQDG